MRDYEPMLELADDLEHYTGYMDSLKQQEANKLRASFDQKRREFVYALIKGEPDRATLWPSVSADLARIDAAGNHYPGAVELVRSELEKHIAKQAGNHPIARFVTRWALPAGSAAAAIVYAYVQFNRS